MLTNIRRIFRIAQAHKLRFAASQIAMALAAICTVGYSTLISPLVNDGMIAGNSEAAVDVGIKMLMLAVGMGICMAIAATQAVFFSQSAGYEIRKRLYERLQEYSFENFDHRSTGDLMVRLNADVVNVQNATQFAIMLGSYAPFMLIITIVLAAATTPGLVWVLLVLVAALIAVMGVLVPAINRAYNQRQQRLDDLNNTLQENLTGISVVKAFVREQYEIRKFRHAADNLREPVYAAAWRVAFFAPLLTGMSQIAIICATWAGGNQVLGDDPSLSVGDISAFSSYVSLIIAPLALLSIVIPLILRGDVSAGRIFEAYEVTPTIEQPTDAMALPTDGPRGRIEFRDVSFAFRRPDGVLDPPALQGINLTIEPGQQVGFLGATGAGKSALVNLIPRFYDVTEGSITIDGIDVRQIELDELRRFVGIALQEAVLFQGQLRSNLKFARPEVDDEVMFGAARAADAFSFASRLPGGWDAEVARRGYNFSGGQRQRLSITRALTQQPRVIILDDSTSALDASTEGRVQAAIPEFVDGATTIYVAQRISAVIDLDHIYLLDQGRIVAEGSHEDLLASSQLYRDIYDSQLGGGVTAGIDLEEAGA